MVHDLFDAPICYAFFSSVLVLQLNFFYLIFFFLGGGKNWKADSLAKQKYIFTIVKYIKFAVKPNCLTGHYILFSGYLYIYNDKYKHK